MLEANFINTDDKDFTLQSFGTGKYKLVKNKDKMYWRRTGGLDRQIPTIKMGIKDTCWTDYSIASTGIIGEQDVIINNTNLILQAYENNVSLAKFLGEHDE